MERARLRERLNFVPKFEGALQLWARKFAIANEWRTRPTYDADDLMQEYFFIFCRIRDHYPEVTAERHFMALFMTGCSNWTTNVAKRRTRRSQVDRNFDEAAVEPEKLSTDGGMNDVVNRILVEDAPPVIRRLLVQLVTTNTPARMMAKKKGRRETTDEFIERLTKIDATTARAFIKNFTQGESCPT